LSGKEGDVGLTVFDDIICLFGFSDDSDGTNQEVWNGLSDVFREGNL